MNEDQNLFKVIPVGLVEQLEKLLMGVPMPLQQSQHFLPIINQMKQAQTVKSEPKGEEESNEVNLTGDSNKGIRDN